MKVIVKRLFWIFVTALIYLTLSTFLFKLDVNASSLDTYSHLYDSTYYLQCSNPPFEDWSQCYNVGHGKAISFENALTYSFSHDFTYFFAWKKSDGTYFSVVYPSSYMPILFKQGNSYYLGGFGNGNIFNDSVDHLYLSPDMPIMTSADGTFGFTISSTLFDIENTTDYVSNFDLYFYDEANNSFGDLFFAKNWNLNEDNIGDLPWSPPTDSSSEPEPTPTPTPTPSPTPTPTPIEDVILDDTPPDLSGLDDSAGWLPAGPIDSILNLPLSLFNNINDNLTTSCQPVTLTLPFVHETIELPCLNSIYSKIDGLPIFVNSVGLVAGSFILFRYLMGLYKWVDKTLSMRDNSDDWGGV